MEEIKDLKWKLMRISGVDETLADKIVKSGVTTMQQLSFSNGLIKLAYNLDLELSQTIRAAAHRFSRAGGEFLSNEQVEDIQKSKPEAENLKAVGLRQDVADTLVVAESQVWDIASETPDELERLFGLKPLEAAAAIALAQLVCMYSGSNPERLEEYLKERKK